MSEPLRILLVDDEARILRALKALLRDCTTFQTINPLEAAALAKQHDVDVVICDQRMPEKPGIDVLSDIKEIHPRAMRILLTGYVNPELLSRSTELAGLAACVMKLT